MTPIEDAIAATLARMRSTEFKRGTNDCDAIMADYVVMVTGLDPMAAWRGQYSDDAGAIEFINKAGGNLALVTTGMASIGIEPAEKPSRSCVVVMDYHGEQITGLCLGDKTAFKTRRGYRMAQFGSILRAWAVK